MASPVSVDTTQTLDGTITAEVRWMDDGTVEVHEGGKLIERRRQTGEEAARLLPPPRTDTERLDALVDALASVSSMAEVRAAARKAVR